MPTLEERVAALEAQLATIEHDKYQTSYSGQGIDSVLDFINERKIVVGHAVATVSNNSKVFEASTNVDYDSYSSRPLVFVQLGFIGYDTANTFREVKPSIMYLKNVIRNSSGKIAFYFQTYEAPNPSTGGFFSFQYIIMEKT
jgi:hypothetical protein